MLPPRPKPGRKPNHCDSKRGSKSASPPPPKKLTSPAAAGGAKKEAAKLPIRNMSVPAACPKAAQQQQAPIPVKKQTKTALKKEIQHIRFENSKLKQELGQLVGNLQALKRQYTPPADVGTRKRHYLEDSTSAFLKFEEDEEECRTQDESMSFPPLLVTNAKMNLTSSMSSCKTINTDDEDILTMSSSTPNSLVSSDLQHSSSLSASSLVSGHAHQTAIGQSPNGDSQLKFLDDYEQMEFYDKYMRMDLNLPAQQPDDNYLVALDSIKEEETEFKFTEPSSDNHLLSFLGSQDAKLDEDTSLFFSVKQEPNENNDAKLFHEFSGENQPPTATTTTTNSTSTNFYMPPSLEELMDEQDGGFKNFSNLTSTLTNGEINDYQDDFDKLKVEVFDMI